MPAYVKCEHCGQSRPNGQECLSHGDMRECAFLKAKPVVCSYKGGCPHGKGDPPMECSAPDCLVEAK